MVRILAAVRRQVSKTYVLTSIGTEVSVLRSVSISLVCFGFVLVIGLGRVVLSRIGS